jgi:glutaredoxin
MNIVIYHGNNCKACHEEMEYLKCNNVAFTPKNVHDNAEARQELIALGSKTIPTTVIDGEVIVGLDIERIKDLVGL